MTSKWDKIILANSDWDNLIEEDFACIKSFVEHQIWKSMNKEEHGKIQIYLYWQIEEILDDNIYMPMNRNRNNLGARLW